MVKEDAVFLFRIRPNMDMADEWKEVLTFLDKLADPITDSAPLNTAARAILKQCQKKRKKTEEKGGDGGEIRFSLTEPSSCSASMSFF